MLRVNLLSDLSKISISPGGNQVVVLHLNNAAGNDLVLSLTTSEDKIGELVGRIASRMTKVCLEMDYHCKPWYKIESPLISQITIEQLIYYFFQSNSRVPSVDVCNTIQFRSGKNNKSLSINATASSGSFTKTNDGGVSFGFQWTTLPYTAINNKYPNWDIYLISWLYITSWFYLYNLVCSCSM